MGHFIFIVPLTIYSISFTNKLLLEIKKSGCLGFGDEYFGFSFNFRYHAYIGVVIDIFNVFIIAFVVEVKGIVSFLSKTFEVDLIDLDFLSKVVLIIVAIKRMVGRNNYRNERFIIEVTLPWKEEGYNR